MDYANLSNGDSIFWANSDDDMPPRMNVRDAAMTLARSRQEMISNELSRLAYEEYFEDIMQHIRHMEDETLADVSLIDQQPEIQWFMRPFLIDFVIEAHAAFQLLPETLFLTVNLLDRYCSRRTVFKQHYQLVGCAALLIAAKYGDKKESVPRIDELKNICCQLYDGGMFVQMEMHVLNTLGWNLGHPTVDFFTQLMVAEERDELEVEHMAAFLCEIALYHRDFVSTKPSMMARASLALARAILGKPEVHDGEWHHDENLTLMNLSRLLGAPSLTLQRKYSGAVYSHVAQKLDAFLMQQAAMQQQRASPSTPFCENRVSLSHSYGTPQKGLGAVPGIADGYMTPPITPDGPHFLPNGQHPMAQDYQMPPQCPITPTPGPHHQGSSYHGQHPHHQSQHLGQTYFEPVPSHMSHVSY